jgi:hypothetical protein
LEDFTAARKNLEIQYLVFFYSASSGEETMKEETFWSWLRAVRLSRQLISTVSLFVKFSLIG